MWSTRFTERFKCRLPLVGAPMQGVSGGLLAAETTRAGGLGFVAAGHLQDRQWVEQEIHVYHKTLHEHNITDAPLCLGFIGHSVFKSQKGWNDYTDLLQKYKPAIVQCFAPAICYNGASNVDIAHETGAVFMAQVCTMEQAREAVEARVDALVAQGSEAGGHGVRRELGNTAMTLASDIKRVYPNMLVLAAGGIVSGAQMASMLAIGCDGVVVGTRLWASKEALGHASYKERLVEAHSCDAVVRTTVFDQIQNAFVSTPWPYPYDSMGVVRNKVSDEWDGRYDELQSNLQRDLQDGDDDDGGGAAVSSLVREYKRAQRDGDANVAAVHGGKGVGGIASIECAYEIVMEMEEEAMEAIGRLQSVLPK
jgi:nitronate monooxygenase